MELGEHLTSIEGNAFHKRSKRLKYQSDIDGSRMHRLHGSRGSS